jgi:AcrR family transcriptional regulator
VPDAAVPADVDGRRPAAETRTMGRRGQRTRRRLLECTASSLDSASYREVRVVDIARAAEMSPAAFYQYFNDVEAAVLALAGEMAEDCGPELAALVGEHPWDGPAAWETAVGVADGFLSVWDRHRAVLRVVDLATDEGDQRFRDLRTRFLRFPTDALVQVLSARSRGAERPDPRAEAGVAISMLAHVAAHHEGLEQWGAPSGDLRQAMAPVLDRAVPGEVPPASGTQSRPDPGAPGPASGSSS